jgi:hypothetical protein
MPCSLSAPANIDPAARVHHVAVPRILPTSSIVANTTKTAPRDAEEIEVVAGLVVEAYRYAGGTAPGSG